MTSPRCSSSGSFAGSAVGTRSGAKRRRDWRVLEDLDLGSMACRPAQSGGPAEVHDRQTAVAG